MHGDDFFVEGNQSDLEWVRDVLAAKYVLPRARRSEKASWYWGRGLARKLSLVGGSEACRENPAGVWNGFRKSVGRSRSQAAGGGRG